MRIDTVLESGKLQWTLPIHRERMYRDKTLGKDIQKKADEKIVPPLQSRRLRH